MVRVIPVEVTSKERSIIGGQGQFFRYSGSRTDFSSERGWRLMRRIAGLLCLHRTAPDGPIIEDCLLSTGLICNEK